MSGVVSGEMFRHMQNSEIIRKMTEEFDEVCIGQFSFKFREIIGCFKIATPTVIIQRFWINTHASVMQLTNVGAFK